MTQSGQGEEPSARPAREGIVLPSDGGEPLLPGMTGGPGDAPAGRRSGPPPTGQAPASAPAEGQTWGQPWGPDQQTPSAQPGQSWQSPPPQQWAEPPAWDAQHPAPGTPGPGELPPEGAQSPNPYAGSYGPPAGGTPLPPEGTYGSAGTAGSHPGNSHAGAAGPQGTAGYGTGPAGQQPQQADAYGPGPAGGQSPQQSSAYGSGSSGGQQPQQSGAYGPGSSGGQQPQQADAYGRGPAGGQQPEQSGAYGPGSGGQQSPQSGAYGPAGGPSSQQPGAYGAPGGGALPPASGAYGPAGGQLPQQNDAYGPAGGQSSQQSDAYGAAAGRAPLPPAVDEGATQYLPPVAAGPADEGATQYIPPVGPGALPPEMPAEQDSEATRFLGTGPLPPASNGPASNPDAEATQYIAPVPGGGQQPPAGFESLFRSESGAESPAAATQQIPRFEQPEPQPSYAPPGGGRSGRGGRTGSRVPVIAAVGIGIAVLGIGAGALLAGSGGGDDDGGDNNKTVAASAPATDGSASPSADPARAQAVELDKLLADSGNSRSTVINAVADVKGCDNLGQAAKDLRDAAKQRTQLVTRLSGITVDKLPDHAALTTALTKAWQASASADNHYAAWADQTAGKKGCKKGQARVTGQTQAGNRASGVASTEKTKAARLWNGIAKEYGLTERQPTQL
ncbi:hypothetical protein ABZ192_21490 [Streptomyces sp. NPDC006235]|uniref:hypothetical protein n=1 Tax=Streptomyces sp. NPDC006235 TaxID=3156736 RepID=UPI0033AFF4A6